MSQVNVGAPANKADGISDYLKLIVESPSGVRVVGYITEGTSMNISNSWESLFEGDTIGAKLGQSISGATQMATSQTTKTTLNTAKVWQGTDAITLDFSLYFRAIDNPKKQVHDAIEALFQMSAPELKEKFGIGRIPPYVLIDVGRRIKLPEAVIMNVDAPLDGPRDKNGYLISAIVNLTVSTPAALNASDMPNVFIK